MDIGQTYIYWRIMYVSKWRLEGAVANIQAQTPTAYAISSISRANIYVTLLDYAPRT